jgi:hypothetical protein
LKILKLIALLCLAYAGLVVAFESVLGTLQPAGPSTLVITTTDADGVSHDRVVSRLESGGQLFVAANHWPRAWYRRTLENPSVQVVAEGLSGAYTTVPISGTEYDRVHSEHDLGIVFRVLTGFPPRRLLRLEKNR